MSAVKSTAPQGPRRAALYVAASRGLTGARLDDLRRFCLRHGLQVVAEHIEVSKSTAPQLELLRSSARQGHLDAVVTETIADLASSAKQAVLLLHGFAARGVRIVATVDRIDSETGADTVEAMLSALVALDCAHTRWRARNALQVARERGVRIGRPAVHVPVEAARELLAEGRSLRQVARDLSVAPSTLSRALKASVRRPQREEP